jgi:hypothetical protein
MSLSKALEPPVGDRSRARTKARSRLLSNNRITRRTAQRIPGLVSTVVENRRFFTAKTPSGLMRNLDKKPVN